MHGYRPDPAVLARLHDVRFVAVVGPSGAGKTSLIKAAMAQEPDVHLILSDTTRPPRPGEQDGVDYNFRRPREMQRAIARRSYVNVAPSLNGTDFYATHPDSYPHKGVGVMALLSEVVPEFRALPFASFGAVYVLPPSAQIWQDRMSAHHFTPEQQAKRYAEAWRSLQFACHDPDVLFVINDDLSQAAQDFIALVRRRPRTLRQRQDQAHGRELAQTLLTFIKKRQ